MRRSPSEIAIGWRCIVALAGAAAVTADAGDEAFKTIDPIYLKTNIQSLIHIRSDAAARNARQYLIKHIWSGKGFPKRSDVKQEVLDAKKAGVAGVQSYGRLTVEMDKCFKSVVYFMRPQKPNGRLMIYHQGHSMTWQENGGQTTVDFFTKRGFDVLVFLMPLFGENTGPIKSTGNSEAHNQMGKMSGLGFNPLKIFVEPIAVVLNHMEKINRYKDIGMIGISGGGWTTHVYAAIDPRIKLSFPVAGSAPWYLRTGAFHGKRDEGDWEQAFPKELKHITYLDIYILAAHGPGRKHLQVINQFDKCCFAGIRYRTYERAVKETVAKMGKGSFEVFLDSSHRDHLISKHTLEKAVAKALGE